MDRHQRNHGHGFGRGQRWGRRQHLVRQKEAGKDRKTSGEDGASTTELDDRLGVGEAGKRIRRAGKLKHQDRMSEAVVAAQNEADLGGFVGCVPSGKVMAFSKTLTKSAAMAIARAMAMVPLRSFASTRRHAAHGSTRA